MLLQRLAAASLVLFLMIPLQAIGSAPSVPDGIAFTVDLSFLDGPGIVTERLMGLGPELGISGDDWELVHDPTPGSPTIPWFATTISIPGEIETFDLRLSGNIDLSEAEFLSMPRATSPYEPSEPFLPWGGGYTYPASNIMLSPIGYRHEGGNIQKVYSLWITPMTLGPDGSESSAASGEMTITWNPTSPPTREGDPASVPGTVSITPYMTVNPEYLIITDPELVNTLTPMAEWRSENSIPASVISLQDIIAAYPDRDAPESIRDYLRDVLVTWGKLKYVLLAGDWDKVPTKYVYDSDAYPGWDDGRIPADSYYSCLDGTWDLDGDGTYGEIGDLEDIIPDIAVSRIAMNDPTALSDKIAQIIEYESIGPSENWSSRAVLIAANTHNEGDGTVHSDYLWDKYLSSVYSDKVPLYEDQSTLDTASIDDAFQAGAGFVQFVDHGGPTVWCDNYGYGVVYNDWNAENLDNAHMLPFISTLACLSNWFDDTSQSPQWFGECIGEAFTENVEGGAIGYAGSSRTSVGILGAGYYLPYDNGLQEDIAQQLGGERQFVMGSAFTQAKRHYAEVWGGQFANEGNSEVSLCWLEFTLLGEPGAMLWTDAPMTLSVIEAHDDDLDPHITLTVTDDQGLPFEGANVTVRNCEMGVYATGTTDDDGAVEFDLEIDWFCDIELSVRGPNARLYRSTITISDTIPPVSTLMTDPPEPDGQNGWFTTAPVVRIVPDEEGVVLCRIGDGPSMELNASNNYTLDLPMEGAFDLRYRARDIALNDEAEKSATIKVDLSDPIAELTVSPSAPDGSEGYYCSEPLVTISSYAPDPGSEVRFHYRIGGGKVNDYTGPFFVGDGDDLLEAFAVDGSGRTSEPVFAELKIDTVPPNLTAIVSPRDPDGLNGWYATKPMLRLETGDVSDVVQYRIGSGTFQTYSGPFAVPEGRNTIWFRATDIAGNVGETGSMSINVDATSPTIRIEAIPKVPNGQNGIYATTPRIVIYTTDQMGASASYSIDGGAWRAYTAPFTVLEGVHSIDAFAIDPSGRESPIASIEVEVDLTAPNVTAMFDRAMTNGFYMVPPLISLASDEGSIIRYSFGEAEETYQAAFMCPGDEGSFTLTCYATDRAGNNGEPVLMTLKVDALAPRLDPAVNPLARDRFLLDLSGTEDAFEVEYRILEGSKVLSDWSSQAEREVKAGPGEHILIIEARDEAGNYDRTSVKISVERDHTWLWVLFFATGTILICAILALFVLWRRRGGRRNVEAMVLD
jgi:hypothetical protein